VTVEVREAEPGDDLVAAGAVVQRAYFALPGYPRDPEYDASLGNVAARADDAIVVLAFLDRRVVGCVTYVPDHHNPHAEHDDPDAASFRAFGVDPEVQGQGVGAAMLEWIVGRARRDGRHRVRIHTLESMPGAQRAYARFGYVRDPEHDEDWDGINGLAYVLHL
jgi:GNAT superfamily N-acetyltransferase